MKQPTNTLIDLEKKFWQALVDQDAAAAMKLLGERALMVGSHGAIRFDREGYRRMLEQGSMVVASFEISDMDVFLPNDTTAILTYHVRQGVRPRRGRDVAMQAMNDSSLWLRTGDGWQCVMHTETPAATQGAAT